MEPQLTKDCSDKNSDSAVSSKWSLEKIQSFMEIEWNETSSNSSRNNADVAISEYSAEQQSSSLKQNQKKPPMFKLITYDKRPKSSPTDSAASSSASATGNAYRTGSVEPNYILDYAEQQQQIPYYPYVQPDVQSCSENTLQYYQHCVNQNHSYATVPLTVSTVIPTVVSEPLSELVVVQQQPEVKLQPQESITKAEHDSHYNRDEQLAQMLNIPILTEEIVNLPIDEFNDRLSKHDLTDLQLSTIRDIRRRGKNKVAAQNCRKRKLSQFNNLQTEVVNIVERKSDLLQKIDHYSQKTEVAKIQHKRLYKFLSESGYDGQQHMNDESSSGSDGSFFPKQHP